MKDPIKTLKKDKIQWTIIKDAGLYYGNNWDATTLREETQTPFRLANGGLCYCTAGEAEIQINARPYHITPNTLITLFPDMIMQVESQSSDFAITFYGINTNVVNDNRAHFLPSLFWNVYEHPCMLVPEENKIIFDHIGSLIRQKRDMKKTPFFVEQIKELILLGCYEIANMYSYKMVHTNNDTLKGSRQREIFRKFLEMLCETQGRERSLEYYSNRLSITPKYLSIISREYTQLTANKWINRYAITQICNMLRYTDKSIQEISYDMNFKNPSFFGQYFKRETGLTPLTYRRSAQKG